MKDRVKELYKNFQVLETGVYTNRKAWNCTDEEMIKLLESYKETIDINLVARIAQIKSVFEAGREAA